MNEKKEEVICLNCLYQDRVTPWENDQGKVKWGLWCLIHDCIQSGDDSCEHGRLNFGPNLSEFERREEARVKRYQIEDNKRHQATLRAQFKGVILGAVIGAVSSIVGGTMLWIVTRYLMNILPLTPP